MLSHPDMGFCELLSQNLPCLYPTILENIRVPRQHPRDKSWLVTPMALKIPSSWWPPKKTTTSWCWELKCNTATPCGLMENACYVKNGSTATLQVAYFRVWVVHYQHPKAVIIGNFITWHYSALFCIIAHHIPVFPITPVIRNLQTRPILPALHLEHQKHSCNHWEASSLPRWVLFSTNIFASLE